MNITISSGKNITLNKLKIALNGFSFMNSTSEKVEEIFTVIMLVSFVGGPILLCFIAFQLAVSLNGNFKN